MPRQVLFIHGGGGGAFEADAVLAESLRRELGSDYAVRYPEMPDEEEPDYQTWKRIIREHVDDMGAGALLVGHSIGASVLIRIMCDGDAPRVGGVFLMSGPFWHEHEFWRWDQVALRDDGANFPNDVPLYLYHGADDEFVPVAHLDMYAKALPHAVVRRLPGRNHQLNDDLSDVARDIERVAPASL